jgi:predicted histone-like DNA-binding protein
MAVKFKVVERGNPLKPTDPKKFYASTLADGEISLREISKKGAAMSTVNPADFFASNEILIQVLCSELAAGKIVRLGDFGYFQLIGKSKGELKATDVNAKSIDGIKVQFRPGKEVKLMLNNVEFVKA